MTERARLRFLLLSLGLVVVTLAPGCRSNKQIPATTPPPATIEAEATPAAAVPAANPEPVAAPEPIADPGPTAVCEALRARLAEPRIFFDYDRSSLRGEAADYVRQVAADLNGAREQVARVVVEGHADERGTVDYNLSLGARRAREVRDALLAAGAGGLELDVISYGKERPLYATAASEEEHARNRRSVFVVECAGER